MLRNGTQCEKAEGNIFSPRNTQRFFLFFFHTVLLEHPFLTKSGSREQNLLLSLLSLLDQHYVA